MRCISYVKCHCEPGLFTSGKPLIFHSLLHVLEHLSIRNSLVCLQPGSNIYSLSFLWYFLCLLFWVHYRWVLSQCHLLVTSITFLQQGGLHPLLLPSAVHIFNSEVYLVSCVACSLNFSFRTVLCNFALSYEMHFEKYPPFL